MVGELLLVILRLKGDASADDEEGDGDGDGVGSVGTTVFLLLKNVDSFFCLNSG